MTIIAANYYLNQLLAPPEFERIARHCCFCIRKRAMTPWMLVIALLRAFGGDKVDAMQPSTKAPQFNFS